MVFSYRWAISEPLRQNFWYFRPTSFPIGHWGQEQPLSSLMHMKLLPTTQNNFSPAFDAQLL